MDKTPLVSIITPSFNQARFLEDTLLSVINQDYANIEYLVVDGASNDGSLDIIRKHEKHINWWISEKDQGQADAINKGFRRAKGEFIAWLNSDDMYACGAITKAVRALIRDENLGMVFSNVFSIDADNEVFNTMRYGDYQLADLMAFNIIGQPGVFMRRSVLEKAGLMDLDFHYLLDHQLWLRMAEIAPIQYIDDYFAAARFHEKAKNVALAAEFGREAFAIVEWMRTRPELSDVFNHNYHKILSGAYRLSGRYLLDGGFNARASGHYLKSLWYHPATAWSEMHRMLYALASTVFPLEWVRERFVQKRSDQVRAEQLSQYNKLFKYDSIK